MWLVTDFESTMMGGPFVGHEVVGFDPTEKKYQVSWVDSMSTSFTLGTGTFDAKTSTFHSDMHGKESLAIKISYKRRK